MTADERAELVREIAVWLRHIDRLYEIPGARAALPYLNPLWDASYAIEREFLPERRCTHAPPGARPK